MTNEEMKFALDRANGALVERIGKQPYIRLDLALFDTGVWEVGSAYLESDMRSRFAGERRDTPEEAFASVFKAIAALPSPEEAVTREYLGKIASAIDYATEHSIADEYVTPLRGVTMAMTDNLLTKEPNT
ncbi:hypothetical protein [Yoonia sp.]|uniref:hypothetical protein n=1 Tax=Yoonia sp. TaxID=2212373 RepID=UPI002E079C85|nr:hypothetical protein [Yoonia sp.]